MPGPNDNRLMDVLAAIIDSLKKVRAPYIMIGAWALAAWGRPRATMDFKLEGRGSTPAPTLSFHEGEWINHDGSAMGG